MFLKSIFKFFKSDSSLPNFKFNRRKCFYPLNNTFQNIEFRRCAFYSKKNIEIKCKFIRYRPCF